MGVDLMGGHLCWEGIDIDVVFATISCTTDTGSISWFKSFFVLVKVVYSTLYNIIA